MQLNKLKKQIDNLTSGLKAPLVRQLLESLREVVEFPENLPDALKGEYQEIFHTIGDLTLGDERDEFQEIMEHLNNRIGSIPKKTVAVKTAGIHVEQDKDWKVFEVHALIKDNFFEKQKSQMADIKWRQTNTKKPKLFFYREAYKKLLPFQKALFKETFLKENQWLELEEKQKFTEEQLEEIDDFYANFSSSGKDIIKFITQLGNEAKTLSADQKTYLLKVQSEYVEVRPGKYEKEILEKLGKGEESEEEKIKTQKEKESQKEEEYVPIRKRRKKEKKPALEISKKLNPRAIIQIEEAIKEVYGNNYRDITIYPTASKLRKVKEEEGLNYLANVLKIKPDKLAKEQKKSLEFGGEIYLYLSDKYPQAANIRLVIENFFSSGANLYKKGNKIHARLLNKEHSENLIGAVVVCGGTIGTIANWFKKEFSAAQIDEMQKNLQTIPSAVISTFPAAETAPEQQLTTTATLMTQFYEKEADEEFEPTDSNDKETKEKLKKLKEDRAAIKELETQIQLEEHKKEERKRKIEQKSSEAAEQRKALEERLKKMRKVGMSETESSQFKRPRTRSYTSSHGN